MTIWKGTNLHRHRDEKGLACLLGFKSSRWCLAVAVTFNWMRKLSWSHELVETERKLWTLSSLTPPCSEQGYLQQAPQGHVQPSLNISSRLETWVSLGKLSQWKKYFLKFKWNFLYFSLCSLPFILSLGTTAKRWLLYFVFEKRF